MKPEHRRFVRLFLKELEADNAAIFAGAGLSMPAGYVNWYELLRPLAEELEIENIKKEKDLVSLAQYYFNHVRGRGRINQLIMDEIGISREPTENHRILARLPITTYWTINYDKLIERALEQADKIPDVKYTTNSLAVTKAKRDAVVYKMHGDADHPDHAVIIRNDYEQYPSQREPFITALSGDLVEKTFLFVGLSFTDPNIHLVLSRVRRNFELNRRPHYALMREYARAEGESEEDYRHALIMQRLFFEDLKEYGIRVILVDEYSQITDILKEIERGYRGRSILISGSASSYDPWSPPQVEAFAAQLARLLIQRGFRLVSGFGLGIGNHVVTGAMAEVFENHRGRVDDHIKMRPFPYVSSSQPAPPGIWDAYREEMASSAGIALFVFGNKIVDGEVVEASGVIREFEIAREKGLFVVPIGGTGWAAHTLYERVTADFGTFYPQATDAFREHFQALGEQKQDLSEYFEPLLQLVTQLTGEQ